MTQRQSQVKVGLLTINQFAQVCRTTPRTIRFYDQKGLLKPFKIDPWNKYRYYKAEQARDFFKLTLIHNFGLTLSQVRKMKTRNRLDLPLAQRLKQLRQDIDAKQKEYAFLQEMQQFMFGELDLRKTLQPRYFGPYTLFCTLVENCRYDEINSVIYKLKGEAKRLGIPVVDEQMVFYLEEGYHPQGTKLEISLICKNALEWKRHSGLPRISNIFDSGVAPTNVGTPQNDELRDANYFKTYPKTKTLSYTYTGPFQYLTFIHKKLQEYIFAKKLLKGRIFDLHKRGPWNSTLEYNHVTMLGFSYLRNIKTERFTGYVK